MARSPFEELQRRRLREVSKYRKFVQSCRMVRRLDRPTNPVSHLRIMLPCRPMPTRCIRIGTHWCNYWPMRLATRETTSIDL